MRILHYNFNTKTIQVIKNNSVNPIKANISDDSEGDGPKDITFAIRNMKGPGSIGADSLLYLYINDNEANAVKKFAAGNIKMYPNPGSGTLYLNSAIVLNEIQILAMDGRTVLVDFNKSGQFSMDIQSLAPGVYNVRAISMSGDVYTEPLFVK
jgi:Secretion system C-terminal sorting domain